MKQVKAPCSSCLRKTTHSVLYELSQEYDGSTDTFTVLQCDGCQTVSFCKDEVDFELDSRNTSFYPSPITRKKPKWLLSLSFSDDTNISDILSDLLLEIYQAMAGRQFRLAAMGIRALLEQAMIIKVGDHGSFNLNIEEFQKQGYISTVQFDILQNVLEFGHAAMHRGFKPDEGKLQLALDIVEAIIGTIFSYSQEVVRLSDGLPPRITNSRKKK